MISKILYVVLTVVLTILWIYDIISWERLMVFIVGAGFIMLICSERKEENS